MDNVILTQTTKESLVNEITIEVISGIRELLKTAQDQSQETKEYITRKEAAKLLKVSLVTISEWSKPNNGTLKPYRIGSRIRFKKKEVLEALTAIETKHG